MATIVKLPRKCHHYYGWYAQQQRQEILKCISQFHSLTTAPPFATARVVPTTKTRAKTSPSANINAVGMEMSASTMFIAAPSTLSNNWMGTPTATAVLSCSNGRDSGVASIGRVDGDDNVPYYCNLIQQKHRHQNYQRRSLHSTPPFSISSSSASPASSQPSLSTRRQFPSSSYTRLRRKRPKFEKCTNPILGHGLVDNVSNSGGNDGKDATSSSTSLSLSSSHPFQYTGETLQEYNKMASLSPWTPVPDSVARKIFDNASIIPNDDDDDGGASSGEVHVELGCGDGRVNFHAVLSYNVSQSIGIDVDPNIIQVAQDRLSKIHPKPNLQFYVSDLLDPESIAWKKHEPEHDDTSNDRNETGENSANNNYNSDGKDVGKGGLVSKATILTMYFEKSGLERIRPYIENALIGKHCKIFTCGYPMPGWNSKFVETVLDMPIYFYDWGNFEDEHNPFFHDPLIETFPTMEGSGGLELKNMSNNNSTSDPFLHQSKKKSAFKPDPLKGYHPDDLIDYAWDDFDDDDDEEEEK